MTGRLNHNVNIIGNYIDTRGRNVEVVVFADNWFCTGHIFYRNIIESGFLIIFTGTKPYAFNWTKKTRLIKSKVWTFYLIIIYKLKILMLYDTYDTHSQIKKNWLKMQ